MTVLGDIEAAVPALRRYAWSLMRHGPDADDLVQDCLAQALGRLSTRTGEGDVRPWLFTIMHNLFFSRWRRARRWQALFQRRDEETEDPGRPPSQEWNLVTRELVTGVDRLPPEQRQVLLLVAVEGFEYREAAGILGIPVGTVMSRLSRARDALRRHVDGVDSSDSAGGRANSQDIARPMPLRRVR
jgi:RNA polymerase sigma-70 factor (ECF subfamily)